MPSLINKGSGRLGSFAGAIVVAMGLLGCAPQRTYRVPVPSSGSTPPAARVPPESLPSPTPPPPAPEVSRRPLPQEPKIQEQDIRTKTPPKAQAAKEAREPTKQGGIDTRPTTEPFPGQPTAPALADDSSLLAKITPSTPPQRAASLRLTEEGRKLLDAGEPAKALTPLERTIAIDSTNPYGYFYLAKAQYRLGRYRESLNFLDVAESRLSGEPFWMAEVHALRGENFRAQGQGQRAELSYTQALRLNSGNRTAADGLAHLQSDLQPAVK